MTATARETLDAPARSKYGNRKVQADGFTFDSQAEYRRYRELKLLEAAVAIKGLQVHPLFALRVNGQHIGNYEADFSYIELPGERHVVEDVKGVRTAVYRLKKRMVKALYGIDITEVAA